MTTYLTRIEMLQRNMPPCCVGAEIGVQRGEFSAEIIQALNPKRLYLIDAWEAQTYPGSELDSANIDAGGHESNYRHVLRRFDAFDCVRIIKGYSPSVLSCISSELHFAYIDSRHDYGSVLADLCAVQPLLREDGIIFGHDFTDKNGFQVIDSVNEFTSKSQWKLVGLTDEEWPSFMLKRE